MELKFYNDERIVNSWDYGKDKKANLTVTDKRIISSVRNEKGIKRSEMPVEDVKTVNFFYGKLSSVGKTVGAILLLIIGVIGFVQVSIITTHSVEVLSVLQRFAPMYLGEAIFFTGLGVLLLINRKRFSISLTSRSGTSDGIAFGEKNKNRKKPSKIMVILTVGLCLCGVIGWIILIIKACERKRTKRESVKEKTKIKIKIKQAELNLIAKELGAALLDAAA